MSNPQSLEALLNKATSPLDNESHGYIDDFIEKVKLDPEGAVMSTRLLAHKIQSPQESEALKALQCLESCVKYCGEVFERELGKYRFLNELIKVVSPKYLGKQSTERVQKKIVSMLYTWSCHFVEQNKIRDAYQMLKKQGVVTVDPPFDHSLIMHVPPPRDERNSIFNDNEKRKELDKLLKSQRPEDLQAANRLIKQVVQAEEAKMEKMKRRNEILEETSNNVRLLGDMLECFDQKSSANNDNLQTMQDLYDSCQKLRPTLFRLASDTDDSETALMDILRANDDVSRVMQLFEKVVNPTNNQSETEQTNELSSISNDLEFLSLTPPTSQQQATEQLLFSSPTTSHQQHFNLLDANGGTDDQLLFNFPPASRDHVMTTSSSAAADDKLLNFTNFMTSTSASSSSSAAATSSVLCDVIKPTPTSAALRSSDHDKKQQSALSEIDQLSSGLIEMSLGRKPEGKFPTASHAQPTLKELQQSRTLTNVMKEQQKQKTTTQILSGGVPSAEVLSLPIEVVPAKGLSELLGVEQAPPPPPPPQQPLQQQKIDDLLGLGTTEQQAASGSSSVPTPTGDEVPLPLNDVSVMLESIRPSSITPLTIHDSDNVRVMIHFAKDHACATRTDTLVSVVSIMSTKALPLTGVIFQAAAPKVMRVKLQTPSSTSLQAYNPIASTPPITQIMIIANSSNKEVKLRYKLEYKADGEDSEATSFSGVISGFPSRDKWGQL